MTCHRFFAGAVLLLACGAGHAVDFKTVGAGPAILYDAPSTKGGKLYLAPRGMPVEVVLAYGEWVKVRDMNGDLSWAETSALSARRNVIVRNANVKLRAAPDEAAPVLMSADKGVLLELVDPEVTSWVKVRHKDGIAGFVKAAEVWGI